MFSPQNAADFGIYGSKWVKDGPLPPNFKGYCILVRSPQATFSDVQANGIDADSIAVMESTTFERGELIMGIGDITGFTVTGTVQVFRQDQLKA